MAGGSHCIWIPLLLSCIFPASDNSDVRKSVNTVSRTGNPLVDDNIFSRIPIILPEGIDPKNVNVTSVIIRTCTGMKEQLASLNRQLQDSTLHNRRLDEEAFGLRRDVRLLRLQLATCSSTASAVTDSYQTQLHSKMKQLLETFDTDTFLILKFIPLSREVKTLQRNIARAANSTETASELEVLQSELQEKENALNVMREQIQRGHPNSVLILEIISLQDQVWDIEQEESRRGLASPIQDRRILVLQRELDRKISELQGTKDPNSAMLGLISVHSKIAAIQGHISVHIEKSRTNTADHQRLLRLKTEQLKRKILQLNREDFNQDHTKEILILQGEVSRLNQLTLNSKKAIDSQLRELRQTLAIAKTQQENFEKQLEETEFAQAQVILKVISIMKEVRELQNHRQLPTAPRHQTTTLQVLLQTRERLYARAQAEIEELHRKLRLKSEECSGLEESFTGVKAEFDEKLAELNRTGDSKAALILAVLRLDSELKALEDLISTTKDLERVSDLQGQLEEKQAELNAKLKDIQGNFAQPRIILTVIELQNEIWNLQKQATNGTRSDRVKALQGRVDVLIGEIGDKGSENTKLMLRILSLKSQVEWLEKRLSDAQALQVTTAELRGELEAKKADLQKHVVELRERNQTTSRLILTVAHLNSQLRNLEEERRSDNATSSLTITQLRDQLREKQLQHSRDQAQIKVLKDELQAKERDHAFAQVQVRELQRKLRLKSEECSGLEDRLTGVKAELDQKLAQLNRTGESKAALILSVINLRDELKTLRSLISAAENPERLSELHKQLEEKQDELTSKTADVERLIANPRVVLAVIELQSEIWDLQKQALNGTTADRIKALQTRVDSLLDGISDKGDENAKLILKLMTLQSRVEELQRQLAALQTVKDTQVTELENELAAKKGELQEHVSELDEKSRENAELILSVTNLNGQLRDLHEEKRNAGQTASATITNLREQLRVKEQEHDREQARVKDLESKLNETEAQCSNYEQKLKDLQSDLDTKMQQLQSDSDSVTSLALQVSTLTLQQEELKRQLQKTESKAKIKELQRQIDEKNNELAKKTEELKTRSTQPQRLLQIIAIQTEIEKLVNVASNDTDYARITALQDHLNYLVEGIQDERDENTKLVFQIMTQQDEIARLKKQEDSQAKALSEKIKGLENELEDVRNKIAQKTQVLDSSDVRITNLSSQIMDLHQKIKPLEEEISYLKDTHTDNLAELQQRLNLTQKQLQDSEHRLKDADTKNFNLIMEIADLRAQLKKTQRQASKAAGKNISELEQQLQTQQRDNKKLENANRDLKQEVGELKTCCSDDNAHCEDVQRQLQQSQEDLDRLQQQLQERDASLEEQAREAERLQFEYSNLERQVNQTLDDEDNLRRQLDEKDAAFMQLQQELERQAAEHNKLLEDYNDLQNQINDGEERTIHTDRITFDPDTAHPRILLTAGDTEMATSERPLNVPDNPGRFDVLLAALGRTGFASGRHYWEVSVARKLCYQIGVASERAQRKGAISSFKPTNGFWTIVLNKRGQIRAIDTIPTNIPLPRLPLTLGVLLDYKKGQVSFYDAGARTHLYTFVGNPFTDRMYPFVNFCVEDTGNPTIPIVLLTPGSVEWIK